MRGITVRTLREFWSEHPDSRAWLQDWEKIVEHAEWTSLTDVRRVYRHADPVGDLVVFNVCGNKYRLVVNIAYLKGKLDIRRVMTHKEYDRGDWKNAR